MNASLKVSAVGGIKSFVAEAPESLSQILAMVQLSTTMDFINDQSLITLLAGVAPDMPTGDKLSGKTSVDFDMAPLLKMLSALPLLQAGEYEFVLTVTDSNDEEVSATCTFIKA